MQIELKPRRVNTDLVIGRLILGTMTFGSQVDQPIGERMVGRCRDAGITMFDTANAYNDGRSEEMLGRIVKPFRREIQLASKVGMSRDEDQPLSRQSITRALEATLRRLDTDYLDVYYLHTPDKHTPLDETLACLAEFVREGRIRYIAQSNFAAWQITELNCIATHKNLPKLQISQQMYNLLARRIEEEYLACSRHHGLFNIVYNPLAGGLLTGKHRAGQQPQAGSRFSNTHYQGRYWNEPQFQAVERLRGIAADAGMTLLELAYRWLLSRAHVDCVLIGASSMQHLEANLSAAEGEAPDDETSARVDDIWKTLRGVAPAYNR
jgi:aryl-alcohol dehydrogenase-like predicted oxidoreductase